MDLLHIFIFEFVVRAVSARSVIHDMLLFNVRYDMSTFSLRHDMLLFSVIHDMPTFSTKPNRSVHN